MDMFAPLANSAEEASAWVRGELERAVPEGWRVTGFDRASMLSGELTTVAPRIIIGTSYGVRITTGLDLLVFTWGNTDAGVQPPVELFMSRALVLDGHLVRVVGMKACLVRLFNGFPPNQYGLT